MVCLGNMCVDTLHKGDDDDDDDDNNNDNNNNNNNNKLVETRHEGKVTVLWNQPVQTDRTIPNIKPGAITCDNEKGTRMLIDVAVSGDRNVIKKEAEKG